MSGKAQGQESETADTCPQSGSSEKGMLILYAFDSDKDLQGFVFLAVPDPAELTIKSNRYSVLSRAPRPMVAQGEACSEVIQSAGERSCAQECAAVCTSCR
jgi:hypothetical protein